MEKILVYQVLYINYIGNVDLLGLKFIFRIYLYELYFFRLNKEFCIICDIYVYVYILLRYMQMVGFLYYILLFDQIWDFVWFMMGNDLNKIS